MKTFAKMTQQERAILSALVFVGRLNSTNPPSEWDRQCALMGLREAAKKIDPSLVKSGYFGEFFK